jgi:hypothetical protein
MPQPADTKVEDTKLFALYIHELWWLSHAIMTKTEKLFTEAKVPETGYVLQVSPELHSLIASVLSDAANLKKLIITPSVRLDRESGRQFRLRKARAAALMDLLAGIPLAELINVKVRNTLEHFDEYLDEANLTVSEAITPPSLMAAYNMVLSHWEVFSPRVYPIRVYISSERKFYNMKWSVDLGAMNAEASAIVARLLALPEFSDKEGPGALMLHLT